MSDPHSLPSDRPEAEAHTIASTLRGARQEQGRTLSQAATALQLAVPDLAELERQDDATVVSDVRTMARLRVYGRYLALDPERMLTTALQATGNQPQGGSAGQAPDAPPDAAPTGSALPPPPDGESRGKRVSAVALLVTLGLVAAVGTAAAAVVFSSQPDQQVQLTSPASQQSGEASEGEDQAQSLASDDEDADDGENAGDDEGSSGEGSETADEGTGSEDGGVSGDPADSSPEDTEPAPTDTDPEPPTGSARESGSGADDSAGGAEHEGLPGRPPEETSVQVLDGAGDPAGVDEAVARLEGIGYVVASVNSASNPYEESTVFYSAGWEDEAEALAERVDRLVLGEANPGFSEDIGLHVVVGADWSS